MDEWTVYRVTGEPLHRLAEAGESNVKPDSTPDATSDSTSD
jgi:hypothetical protein